MASRRLGIDTVRKRIRVLARKIEAPPDSLPRGPGSADGAHVEVDARGYHYCLWERGEEFERHTFAELDDLLFHVFWSVSFQIACDYELKHRVRGQDSRRILFEKKLEILARLSPEWERRGREETARILEAHPFDDRSSERLDLLARLESEGVAHDAAWQQACERYPLPAGKR